MAIELPHGPAHALTRGVYRPLRADRPPARRHRRRQAHRHPVRPEEARAHRRPDRAARGHRRPRRRLQRRPVAIAANGTLVYTTGGTLGSRRAVWVSREGARHPGRSQLGSAGHASSSAALSPDGKALAVALSRDGRRTSGSSSSPTARSRGSPSATPSSVRPAWSADGTRRLYVNDRGGVGRGLDLRPPGRRHRRRRACCSTPTIDFGQVVAVARRPLAPAPDRADAAGRNGDIFGLSRPATRRWCRWSPPRRRSCFRRSRPTGAGWRTPRTSRARRRSTCGRSRRPAAAKWQVSTAGGSQPAWSRNGRELFYINGKNEMVSARDPAGRRVLGRRAADAVLGHAALRAGARFHRTAVSPDDQRFLMVREGEATQQSELVRGGELAADAQGAGGEVARRPTSDIMNCTARSVLLQSCASEPVPYRVGMRRPPSIR